MFTLKITTIILLIVIVAILIKTGSLSKSFGLIMKYLFFPGLGGFVGGFIGFFCGSIRIGAIFGTLVGFVLVIKDAALKLRNTPK